MILATLMLSGSLVAVAPHVAVKPPATVQHTAALPAKPVAKPNVVTEKLGPDAAAKPAAKPVAKPNVVTEKLGPDATHARATAAPVRHANVVTEKLGPDATKPAPPQ
jgi:hypothetical protein